jgi:hypothetical protein
MSNIPPIIRGKYVKGGKRKDVGNKLSAHFKYNQYRSMGQSETKEDRYIFTQESDHIQRREAVDDVMTHTSSSVNYHKIVLSPADYEHIDDYRQWTRDVMHDLEEKKGVKLHWYAVVQAHERENTNTPHIHLVLAGAGEDTQIGKTKVVRMTYNDDYKYMREQGREHSNYEFYQALEKEMQQLDREDRSSDPARTQEPALTLAQEWDR